MEVKSEITRQPKRNNLDYIIDPKFKNINGLFVLSFENGGNDPTRNSFSDYYLPLVEINAFNVLIESKPFFNQLVKNRFIKTKKIRVFLNKLIL